MQKSSHYIINRGETGWVKMKAQCTRVLCMSYCSKWQHSAPVASTPLPVLADFTVIHSL